MAVRTVTAALTLARGIMSGRASDPRLTGADRAQAGENVTRIDGVLSNVRADNTVQPNRRNAQATTLRDRVFATITIEQKYDLAPTEFYDALDLMWDVADCIVAGQPSLDSVLGDRV